ncbi:hypothetical protein BDF20DRAFT_822620 [Mycotypha africana]|uniref:uncharacterized protein n=1 Tax=Mycotypha africana TaxID=64632 RepID=UPI0023006907|nr:uncharacterized protein BDF20DRAFT_822620 [Mycotypha africana]KAI8975689.1 hypothetical protein BDF20DRAFT_822620 [Mycotypha africana]
MDRTNGNNVPAFTTDPWVRSAWIAFFTLFAIWGLSYFIRHAFGKPDAYNRGNPNTTGAAAVDDPEAAAAGTDKKGRWGLHHDTLSDRFARSHHVLRDNTLMLLSVLTLNTFGAGSTRAVMILAWIFFAFTVIHALTELAINHHFIRLFFNLLFYALTLAIGGLAFKYGWYTHGSIF